MFVIYNDKNQYILPDNVTLLDSNSLELDLGTYHPITGAYKIAVITGGSDSNLPHIQTFTSSDLDGHGNLSINHNLDIANPIFTIYNDQNKYILADSVSATNSNALELNMVSFAPTMTGTYKIVVASDPSTEDDKYVYTQTFTSIDLDVENKINIVHSLDTLAPVFVVYNNLNKYIIPDYVTLTSNNVLQIDLTSFVPTMTGTYTIAVCSGYAAAAQDPGISDAPTDGKQYGRQNATWTEIVTTNDTTIYLDIDKFLNISNTSASEDIIDLFSNVTGGIDAFRLKVISENVDIVLRNPIIGGLEFKYDAQVSNILADDTNIQLSYRYTENNAGSLTDYIKSVRLTKSGVDWSCIVTSIKLENTIPSIPTKALNYTALNVLTNTSIGPEIDNAFIEYGGFTEFVSEITSVPSVMLILNSAYGMINSGVVVIDWYITENAGETQFTVRYNIIGTQTEVTLVIANSATDVLSCSRTELSPSMGAKKYSKAFTNTDLSAEGILEVVHNLDTEEVTVVVYDNQKLQVITGQTKLVDNNQVNIELLTFMPLTDTYKVVVIG